MFVAVMHRAVYCKYIDQNFYLMDGNETTVPFLKVCAFEVELTKPMLMALIATTPPEYFILLPLRNLVYGIMIGEEVSVYLTNEFLADFFKETTVENVRQIYIENGCKAWGNRDLLNL